MWLMRWTRACEQHHCFCLVSSSMWAPWKRCWWLWGKARGNTSLHFSVSVFSFFAWNVHILLRTYFKHVWCLGKRVYLLTGHIRFMCYERRCLICSLQLNNTKLCQSVSGCVSLQQTNTRGPGWIHEKSQLSERNSRSREAGQFFLFLTRHNCVFFILKWSFEFSDFLSLPLCFSLHQQKKL